MGFFKKLSENMHHGGVKVTVDAPGSVSVSDPSLNVTVTITAEEAQTIKRVRADIVALPQNVAFNAPSNNNMNNTQFQQQQATQEIVARAESNEPFSLAAGESKQVPLQIIMNMGAEATSQGGLSDGMAQAAKMFTKIQSMTNTTNPNAWRYEIHASADVDGIAIDPGSHRAITINGIGQHGTSVQL